MGAQEYVEIYRGTGDMKTAFDIKQAAAFYDYGHAGYTGSIAEAPGTVLMQGVHNSAAAISEADAGKLVNELMDGDDSPRKGDSALAIKLLPNADGLPGYMFFGLAPS